MPDGRIQRPVVRGWHRQLGRGVCNPKPAGCVCQRAYVHGLDQEQHTNRPAVFVDRRRVLSAIFQEQNEHPFSHPIPPPISCPSTPTTYLKLQLSAL